MSFQITGPGFYLQRDGGKAEVFAERRGRWCGIADDSDHEQINSTSWRADGREFDDEEACCDIIAEWHDPPEPPEGFEPASDSDRLCDCKGFVNGVWLDWSQTTTTVAQHKQSFTGGWHYFRRIPKPFRISDHGCGVYETRDGREAVVVVNEATLGAYPWKGRVGSHLDEYWQEDGTSLRKHDTGFSVVRFIGPLPEDDWSPTSDVRVEVEMRWMNANGQSQWRPVSVH